MGSLDKGGFESWTRRAPIPNQGKKNPASLIRLSSLNRDAGRSKKLASANFYSAGSFLTFAYFELNFLTIGKMSALDFRMMNKKIFSVLLSNKAEAFIGIEPFNCSLSHVSSLCGLSCHRHVSDHRRLASCSK